MNGEDKKTILLVEDEALIALAEKRQLEKFGYTVHYVTTGEKAVQTILEEALPIDLILMDIDLGSGIDGTQAAEQILNHKDIPVVFLSSHTESEVVEKTEKITAYGYVVKSSGVMVLDASIKMAFKLFDSKVIEKKKEVMLRQSDKLLNSTQQLARVGGWVWDIEQQTMTWTDETYCIHGMTPGEFAPGTPEHIRASLGCYDPADRPVIEAAFGFCAANGQPYDLEFPLTRIDGSRIWIRTMAYPEKQGDRVVRVFGNIMDITDRKQAEIEVKESHKLFDLFFHEALDGFFFMMLDEPIEWNDNIDKEKALDYVFSNQRITRINDAMLQQYGAKKEDFIKLTPNDFFSHDLKHGREVWKKFFDEGKFYIDTTEKKLDGTDLIINGYYTLLYDKKGRISGHFGVQRNVTEERKIEEALKESEASLQAVLHSTGNGILATGKDKKMLYANVRFSELWRIPSDVFKSGDDATLLQHILDQLSDPEGFLQKVQDLYSSDKESFDVINFNDGRVFERLSRPLLRESEVMGRVWSFHDITERKQAEEEIQKQLSEKETLLREVHHRVKNNIANIEGLLSLQAGSTANPEVKSALQDTTSRVQSMRVLYDKLLISKDYQDISIKSYIEDLIDSLHDVFVDKDNIIIEKHISEFSILSKQALTIGIIINELLTNVFKYAFKDRAKGTVSVSIEKSGNKVTLIIQDNGIGIDKRIMENKSLGFGLTIVKMLIEQLDGTFSIVNENGTKSVIQFEIEF